MKKIITALALFSATIFVACNNHSNSDDRKQPAGTNTDTSKRMGTVRYTCTMHPEVISDTAGQCPKCGMELVAIKDSTMK
jgi:hypothetical protein